MDSIPDLVNSAMFVDRDVLAAMLRYAEDVSYTLPESLTAARTQALSALQADVGTTAEVVGITAHDLSCVLSICRNGLDSLVAVGINELAAIKTLRAELLRFVQ